MSEKKKYLRKNLNLTTSFVENLLGMLVNFYFLLQKKWKIVLIFLFTPMLGWGDYYINVFTYANSQLMLEKGKTPHTLQFSFEKGERMPNDIRQQTKKSNYRSLNDKTEKITDRKKYYLFFYDERFKLRKIEKRIIDKQNESTTLKILFDREEKLVKIEENLRNSLSYEVAFDKNQRQIQSKIKLENGDHYEYRFNYPGKHTKITDFFYRGSQIFRKIEKNLDTIEYYYPHGTAKNSFALDHLQKIQTIEKDDQQEVQWVQTFQADGSFLERKEKHFQNGQLKKTISSKGSLTFYQYDDQNRIIKQTILNKKTKKIIKEISFRYRPISEHFDFEFHDFFVWSTTIEKLLLLPEKSIFSEKQHIDFIGDLARVQYSYTLGDKKIIMERQFDQQRMFKNIWEKDQLKTFSIHTNNETLLAKIQYSYDQYGRITEEKKWHPLANALSQQNIATIKYVYLEPKAKQKEVLLKNPRPPRHSHLFFWGHSLYNYLTKQQKNQTNLGELIDFVKNKKKIALYPEKKGFYNDNHLILERTQKIIDSQLKKILFLNAHDKVISYVRINHKKKHQKIHQLTFQYFAKEPLFYLKKRRAEKWFNPIEIKNISNEFLKNQNGRKEFLQEYPDETASFATENFLESYTFEFFEGQLPRKFAHTINNHLNEKDPFNLFQKTQEKKDFRQLIKETLTDLPLFREKKEDTPSKKDLPSKVF